MDGFLYPMVYVDICLNNIVKLYIFFFLLLEAQHMEFVHGYGP